MITQNVVGFEDIARRMEQLPHKFRKRTVRRAVRQGAKYFRDELRLTTPKNYRRWPQHPYGQLRKNIIHKESRGNRNTVVFKVLARGDSSMSKKNKKNSYYAFFVENGNYGHPGIHFIERMFLTKRRAVANRIRKLVRADIEKMRKGRLP